MGPLKQDAFVPSGLEMTNHLENLTDTSGLLPRKIRVLREQVTAGSRKQWVLRALLSG